MSNATAYHGDEVAIIGMSGRFPGSKNIEEFWNNIRNGVESITLLSDEELLAAGVDPALLQLPNYVKAAAPLQDIEWFDAAFFGISPRDAELLDPQHRLFLECCWEALEQAGYDPETYPGWIGLYGGSGANTYRWRYLEANSQVRQQADQWQLLLGNASDFLTTRVAYKLNLRGPGVTVQTACSTSLVAVHLACQSLLAGECDMVLAGGVSIALPQRQGYVYHDVGLSSPDGHCRAFDHNAQGTIGGSGVGVVVLKLLSVALADGDYIHAVIKGSAINNDGKHKVSFTAPSVDQQEKVIVEALANAQVDARSITYLEGHGTATPLGDAIEVAALAQAFRRNTDTKQFCALGSVKTNLGHLDAAAGIAGVIKTVQALKHRVLPPHLFYEQPNPQIDFANSAFYVNTKCRPWQQQGSLPRRAGVSSFGMGGTNAHLILEEPPELMPSDPGRSWHLLLLSAKTPSALEAMTANLVRYLQQHPQSSLADIAYTYQVGRKRFPYRRMLVCTDQKDAASALSELEVNRVLTYHTQDAQRPLVFMFPGVGEQYVGMAFELYRDERVFREQVDLCCRYLLPHLGFDLRTKLYPEQMRHNDVALANDALQSASGTRVDLRALLGRTGDLGGARAGVPTLDETVVSQPALFVIEYALAQLLMSRGLQPQAMIGYSVGEFVAACLAGVFSLEDSLLVIARRARMIQALPKSAMLAVAASPESLQEFLSSTLQISAINGPRLCVVSGPVDAIALLEERLSAQQVAARRLQVSHAFHSSILEPLVEPLTELVRTCSLHAPRIPIVSSVTGSWISAEEATDPGYWVRHMCAPVLFAQGLAEVRKDAHRALVEVGPGRALCSLALQLPGDAVMDRVVLPVLRARFEQDADESFLLHTLGTLWLHGVQLDWTTWYKDERRLRLPLPTYPFERQYFWIDADRSGSSHNVGQEMLTTTLDKTPPPHVDSLSSSRRKQALNPYVAPRNRSEQIVAEAYSQFLGVEPVGIYDNFFDLGGQSLLAIQLVTQLREVFEVGLSTQIVLEAPNVAELAARIASVQQVSLHSPLVKLQPRGTGSPLFFVHPGGGTVFCYRELARALEPELPLYAFQTPGIDGEQVPYMQIEQLARRYIDAMRLVQPQGPYLLGGWSMGGVIAFEMAQQLLHLGECTALLALLDTLAPLAENHPARRDEALFLYWFFKDLTDGKMELPLSTDQATPPVGIDEALLQYAQQAQRDHMLPADVSLTQLTQLFQIFRTNLDAYVTYQPQTYPGRVDLFFVGETAHTKKSDDSRIKWLQLVAGDFVIHRLPGDHYTILKEPLVQTLADRLLRCIRNIAQEALY